jgi:hypothetical protein
MTEDHKQEDRRAHWAKVPRALLEGFAIVGALLIIVVCLWAFDRPTSPTQKHEFLQSLGVLLAALVGLGGLYFMQVLAAYVHQRIGLETEDLSEANLSGVNLRQADLSRTNLSVAFGWTETQFRAAISLESATMPNGQKYEEWLKDKQARGEDGGGRERP